MLNKREITLIEKAWDKLQVLQADCSARLFNRKDIEETVEEAKKAFDELDPIERKWLVKLAAVNSYSVPVNYRWSAKTSVIEVSLNRYGTLASIDVYRDSAPIEAYGGSASIAVRYQYE